MENEHAYNLAEIIQASSRSGGATSIEPTTADWSFLPEPVNHPPSMDEIFEDFGGRSSSFDDPLLHELLEGTTFANPLDPMVGLPMVDHGGGDEKFHGEEIRGPRNIFSHVLQMDPESVKAAPLSTRPIRPYPMVLGGLFKASNGSVMENAAATQISSPRTPGIKRRKCQARKVVCIPAPAATSNKTSGEVVPSDLWAWRKYGQKPIKGSPHPRGYYRCSSSKGCPARKQVERSRIDPNMLVITYTSEHNHPWPTQRNALAGSTRSQPVKNNSSTSNSSPQNQRPPSILKEEHNETANSIRAVEEDALEMDKVIDAGRDHEFDQVFHDNYESVMSEVNHSDEFFSTGLGELGADPLDLHFTEGLMVHKSDEERNNTLDHFSFFEWAGNSFGEAKGGL